MTNDHEPPALTIDSEPTAEFVGYIVSGTVSDDVGVTEVHVRVNGGSQRTALPVDGSYGAFANLEEGANVVEVTARDAAGNESQQSISVTYTPQPNAPEPPVVGAPSSLDLIDQALTDGDIDEETALLYRVYAIHSDQRLPEALRNETGFMDATPILLEVADRFDSLAPQTQALIEPFLVPPIYEESAFFEGEPATRAKQPTISCGGDPNWASITVGNFRIWWNTLRRGHGAVANAIVGELRTGWAELEQVMGDTPLEDMGPGIDIEHDGCSDHFDVYLDANYSGWAKVNPHEGALGCEPWAGFMTINPTGTHRAELPWLAAHELMHAFQLSVQSCLARPGIRWWAEASAHWAIDHVYPTAVDTKQKDKHFEHVFAEKFYLPSVDQPIYDAGIGNTRTYGAYLWPFYLVGAASPSIIGSIWQAIGTSSSLSNVLGAMETTIPGGFEQSFSDFMLQVWNQEPVEDLKKRELDMMMPINPSSSTPKGVTEVRANLEAPRDENILLSLGVEPLAASFVHVTFDDPSVHSVLFSNGYTFELGEGQVPDFPLPDASPFAKELSDAERRGKKVWALVKQDGQWSKERYDLTDVAFVPFCQDMSEEAIEELVLIFVNSRYADSEPSMPKGLASRLFVSNMGCGPWIGSAKATIDINDAPNRVVKSTTTVSNLLLTRPPKPLDGAMRGNAVTRLLDTLIPTSNAPSILPGAGYDVDSLAASWSYSRTTQSGDNVCMAQGNGMFDENDVLGAPTFVMAPYLAGSIMEQGSLYRSYQINLTIGTQTRVVNESCSETGLSSEPFAIGLVGGTRETPAGSFLVLQDGQTIRDSWDANSELQLELSLDTASGF